MHIDVLETHLFALGETKGYAVPHGGVPKGCAGYSVSLLVDEMVRQTTRRCFQP